VANFDASAFADDLARHVTVTDDLAQHVATSPNGSSGKKVKKVIPKTCRPHGEHDTKKELKKKNRTVGRRTPIIFGITFFTFFPDESRRMMSQRA